MNLDELTPFDRSCLQESVRLGYNGDSRVHPNPRVGAIIAKNGDIIGKGWHQRCGDSHAEINAIHDAGGSIKGSTVYVSLEPCAHEGRTPPCAERLIQEEVSRVVFAMGDPGLGQGGSARLKQAGIEVIGPVEFPAARKLLAPFLTQVDQKRAHLTLKWAMTMDGRIALATGDSRWVTSSEARAHVHQIRSQVDGIMIGARTVLADKPSLNVRHGIDGPDPRPLIWDPKGRLNSQSMEPEWWKTMSERQALIISDQGETSPLEVLPWNDGDGFAEALFELGLHHVLVEGGSGLLGAFLDLSLGDDVLVYLAPKLCGGKESLSPIGGSGVTEMGLARNLEDIEVTPLGPDFLLSGTLPSSS